MSVVAQPVGVGGEKSYKNPPQPNRFQSVLGHKIRIILNISTRTMWSRLPTSPTSNARSFFRQNPTEIKARRGRQIRRRSRDDREIEKYIRDGRELQRVNEETKKEINLLKNTINELQACHNTEKQELLRKIQQLETVKKEPCNCRDYDELKNILDDELETYNNVLKNYNGVLEKYNDVLKNENDELKLELNGRIEQSEKIQNWLTYFHLHSPGRQL